ELPAGWFLTGVTGTGYKHSGAQDGTDCWYTYGWFALNQRVNCLKRELAKQREGV
ncbi:hypothetical protein LCGC14_2752940, partial [marine sediment metagenome]